MPASPDDDAPDLTETPPLGRERADAPTSSAWPRRPGDPPGPPPAEPPEDAAPPGSGSGFRAAAHVWRKTARLVRGTALGAADLRQGPQRLGRYRLIAPLGRGGAGTVYEAWDPRHERHVALKLFTTGARGPSLERFEREVKAQARLRHPGIVPLLDSGVDGGQPFLVTELVEGGSLEARLDRDGPLRPLEAARIVLDAARAVAHAHAEGVLHRDLKPANVLLAADGSARVGDFGLALLEDRATRLTESGAALGTPAYMPPEQLDARGRALDARSDVYGLGATLHHALTGAPPFDAPSVEALFHALIHRTPDPPSATRPDVPTDLDAVVQRCLEKEPGDRYPDCAALIDDLERVLAGEPVRARRPPLVERAARFARRHPVPVALAAALAAALGVAALEAWQLARLRAGVVPPPPERDAGGGPR